MVVLFDHAYRRPIAILSAGVVGFMSLHPGPSPIFHLLFLPSLLLAEKHDRRLFVSLGIVLAVIDLIVAISTTQGQPSALLTQIAKHLSLVLSVIVGHDRTIDRIGQCRVWTKAWSFGILWATLWVVLAEVSPHRAIRDFTPSAGRHEYLRPLLRLTGESGIDMLLATSSYVVFLCVDQFFTQPVERDDESEWYSLLRFGSRSTRTDSKPPAASTERQSGFGEREPSKCSHSTSATSEQDGSYSTSCERDESRTELDERVRLRDQQRSASDYGSCNSLATSIDLIDLESGRSSSTRRVWRTPRETDAISIEPISPNLSETEAYRASLESSEDGFDHFTCLPQSQNREITITAVVVLAIWAILLCFPQQAGLSLSAPLTVRTPLPLACVLPPQQYTLDNLIYHSQTVAGRSKLLLWPKGALHLPTKEARQIALARVLEMVTAKYGVWMVISFKSRDDSVPSLTMMVGPEGLIGSPVADRRSGEVRIREVERDAQHWSIQLAPPHGVIRFNWTSQFPHFRSVHVAAIDAELAGRAVGIPAPGKLPSLVMIPSGSQANDIDLTSARDLSVKHGVPTLLCASSTSALIDPWGNTLFRQIGGETWSANLALPYRDGQDRTPTPYELLGDFGLLVISAVSLILAVVLDYVQWLLKPRDRQKATERDGLSDILTRTNVAAAQPTATSFEDNEFGRTRSTQYACPE